MSASTVTAPVERLYSLNDLVALGYGAHSTLRKYVREGRLPVVRFGRTIKVRESDLKALEQAPLVTKSEADIHIDRLVAAAPTLTNEQIARLKGLLGGVAA